MVGALFPAGGLGSQISREAQTGLLLELSPVQVALVRSHAVGWGSLRALLGEPDAHRELLAVGYREIIGLPRAFSASLMARLFIFAVLPSDGSAISNVEVARVLGMNENTCHRYLRTLFAVGLVEQAVGSRKYRLAR
jgi:hypothetical protein